MDKIENILVSHRKGIQKGLLTLAFLSLFLLLAPDAIEPTGNITMMLLWLILWLPIFAKVFSSKIAGKLMLFRRELGILMGTMAFVHSSQYFSQADSYMVGETGFWVQSGSWTYLGFGFVAFFITMIMTLTSNSWSMKKLGKYWKYLHRLVYIVLIFALLHVAFIEISKSGDDPITALFALIPFIVYFIFKILQWKGITLRK